MHVNLHKPVLSRVQTHGGDRDCPAFHSLYIEDRRESETKSVDGTLVLFIKEDWSNWDALVKDVARHRDPTITDTVYVWNLRTGLAREYAAYTGVASTENLAWELLAGKAIDWELIDRDTIVDDRAAIIAALDGAGLMSYGVSALEVATP